MSADQQQQQEVPQQQQEPEEITYTTDEAALAGRKEALSFYNKGEFEKALPYQVGVLKYFTEKFGENNSKCGIYYLDYGLTLLALIQGSDRSNEAAALAAVDEEDAECCFINLELARVCFEKQEAEDETNVEVKYRIAEVHDALAQLELEKDDSNAALIEFEHTLLLLRDIKPSDADLKKHSQAVASALFNCARCYMQEADYAGAADKLKECLDFIATLPEGTIPADLLEEVTAFHADAVENRDNKTYLKVKESIQELFPDEKHEVLAEEVLGNKTGGAEGGNANPYLSAMPGGNESGHTSSLLMPNLVQIPGRENSNSTSRSVFPMQGTGEQSRSMFSASNGPVNVAVARKKEKKPATATATSATAAPADGEPATKMSRVEASQ